MKNAIIISGPIASGKTTVAKAIASTHYKENVLRLPFFKAETTIFEYMENIHVLILEECSVENIKMACRRPSWTHISYVFITTDEITKDDLSEITGKRIDDVRLIKMN